MPNERDRRAKVQHPLLGTVDLENGPDVLDEHAVPTPQPQVARAQARPQVAETAFPTPEPMPQRPGIRALTRRAIAAGLRKLAERLES